MGSSAIAWSEGDWRSGSGKIVQSRQVGISKIILTWKIINEKLIYKLNPAKEGIFDIPLFHA